MRARALCFLLTGLLLARFLFPSSSEEESCPAGGGDAAGCRSAEAEADEDQSESSDELGENADCQDLDDKCAQWAKKGKCDGRRKKHRQVQKTCRKSCGICQCQDMKKECKEWARDGECDGNPNYMRLECKRSCGSCREGFKPKVGDEDPDEGPAEDCRDTHKQCQEWADKGECSKNPGFMKSRCPVNCGVCQSGDPHPSLRPECQDQFDDCYHWAQEGQCHLNFTGMMTQCQRSCRVCGEKDPCRPNASDAGVFHRPGILNETFERIIATENVTVLSRDPYVILIHNLFSEDELGQVEKAFSTGWERSRVGGVTGADTTAAIRTSQQQWCRADCEGKPAMRPIVRRIEALLKISRRRFEDLQILRYEPGQQYKVHHDFIDEQVAMPVGPRIMTLFLYLTTVPEGGATFFPRLNLTVAPHRSTALLWPSVFDHNPFEMDERTDHLAKPPRGNSVKQAMNFWVHQFDFRRYNSRQCLEARRPRSSYYETHSVD